LIAEKSGLDRGTDLTFDVPPAHAGLMAHFRPMTIKAMFIAKISTFISQ